MIRWLSGFIDRRDDAFDPAVAFWMAITQSTLSTRRGGEDELATLLPADGDAFLRVQRVKEGGGCHLDAHVDDVDEFIGRAAEAGAEIHAGAPVIVRSPSGFDCCVVGHHGESARPKPVLLPTGTMHLVDQLSIDIPGDRFDDECRYWAAITGWELCRSAVRDEYRYLERPAEMPLRLLLQRRDDQDGCARGHLDLAADNVTEVVGLHRSLGARVHSVFEHWTTMLDPAGFPYCVTRRDPRTGALGPG